MSRLFLVWAIWLIVAMVCSGLTVRYLELAGVPFGFSLAVRGVLCLACTVIYARLTKVSLRPVYWKTQVYRAALAGLALTFYTATYKWLNASSIAVLSNIDVPVLLLFGSMAGLQSSFKIRLAAFVAISILIALVFSLDLSASAPGLLLLILSTVLLCVGYIMIKRSMDEESPAITMATPSLAIILFGAAAQLIQNSPIPAFSFEMKGALIVSGLSMFALYIITMKLYSLADIATAEFPTLIAAVVIQPLESLFLQAPWRWDFFGLTIGFVGCMAIVFCWQHRESKSLV